MSDSYSYFPDPIDHPNPFNLTYTTSKIFSPLGNYNLLTSNNTIIETFSPINTFCKGTGIANPNGMDNDTNGNLYIVNTSTNSVIFLNITTKETTTILSILNNPSNICFDKINNCFYLILQGNDADNAGSIGKYIFTNNSWSLDTTWGTNGFITGLNQPHDLAIGNNNILYVSLSRNSSSIGIINSYDLTRATLINENIIRDIVQSLALSFDFRNSILYYSDSNNNRSTVGQANVDNNGGVDRYNTLWSTGYENILYSSFENSHLYVVDSRSNLGTIYKIESDGSNSTIKNNINNPSGLTVYHSNISIQPNANIYYASDIYQINLTTDRTINIVNIINSISGINGPAGILFVSDTNFVNEETLFICNNLNKTI
jgi:hypothetical protein